MTGKRKWSAARAADRLEAAHSSACCSGAREECCQIDERHLARAYLAGIKAAHDVTKPGAPRWLVVALLRSEQARLNPRRAAKRGKAKS